MGMQTYQNSTVFIAVFEKKNRHLFNKDVQKSALGVY